MMIPPERGRVEEIASHQTSQGPADYPSGAMITTTDGHGDMRPLFDLPKIPAGPLSYMERMGDANIADSADEVRLRVRERRRAAQGCIGPKGLRRCGEFNDPIGIDNLFGPHEHTFGFILPNTHRPDRPSEPVKLLMGAFLRATGAPVSN